MESLNFLSARRPYVIEREWAGPKIFQNFNHNKIKNIVYK